MNSGIKKELLIIQFVNAILKSNRISKSRDGIIDLFQGHKLTDTVNEKAKALEERLSNTFKANIDHDNAKWFRSRLNSKIAPMLKRLDDDNIELLSFGYFLMYVNFSDHREKKLSDIFAEYTEPEQYFEVLDMIEEIVHEDVNMYDLARETIKELKG